jgi:uncharacterized phage protein (TIGR01671 family)
MEVKMREIKFRGKRQKNGEWIYGSYISRGHHNYLYDLIIDDKNRKKAVMMKTVGQYTGLKDKNGKEIYEGDFIKAEWGIGNADYRIVGEDGLPEFYHWFIEYCFEEDNLEVIGNKYENPELIENEE